VASRHKSAAVGRFGAAKKGADLDDLGDSLDFDNILGGGSKASKPGAFGGSGGANAGVVSSSTKNTRPPQRMQFGNDDSLFGVTSASKASKPGFVKEESFGGGSRHGGSRKSQAEVEADEFDALLDDIVKPEPIKKAPQARVEDPMPTGTFRNNSEEDGMDFLNFGDNTDRLSTGRGQANNNNKQIRNSRFGA